MSNSLPLRGIGVRDDVVNKEKEIHLKTNKYITTIGNDRRPLSLPIIAVTMAGMFQKRRTENTLLILI